VNLGRILLLFIIFSSCNGTSQTKQLSPSANENWEISNRTIQTHTYTKSGLLDTSYSTSFFYIKGVPVDTNKSVTVRRYDTKNNLVNEKTLLLSNNLPDKVTMETNKKYDDKNNLIYFMSRSEGVNYDRSQKAYNGQNQEIKSVDISQIMEDFPSGTDIDSIALQKEQTKKPFFDTTINTYYYDDNGNMIKWIIANTKGEIKRTQVFIYADSEKEAGYELDKNGDTTTVFKYLEDGELTKEIVNRKEVESADTTWQKGDKIIKVIGHSEKFHIKTKIEIKYNDKGDEIESVSYK